MSLAIANFCKVLSCLTLATPGEASVGLVSVKSGGVQITTAHCQAPALSDDGSVIAFESFAGGIVPSKPNPGFGVYARIPATGITFLVSSDWLATPANGPASSPDLSSDGRFCAFTSTAGNLVAGVPGGEARLYVKDLETGWVELATRTSEGTPTDFNSSLHGFDLSADGRFVAFVSMSPGIVAEDQDNDGDVYVFDRDTKQVELISVGLDDETADAQCERVKISKNGRFVFFDSYAGNLVASPQAKHGMNVFMRDRKTQKTVLVSKRPDGFPKDAAIELRGLSANGRFVGVSSTSSLIPKLGGQDAFVIDRKLGKRIALAPVSKSQGATHSPHAISISNDGKFIALDSLADDAIAAPNFMGRDVLWIDRAAKTAAVLSRGVGGAAATGESDLPVITADGKRIAFDSDASNLVAIDPDDETDVFVATLPQ